jgi:uncharacterized protein (DUF433 family)
MPAELDASVGLEAALMMEDVVAAVKAALFIVSTSDTCGGAWRIRQTRIPASIIGGRLADGSETIKDLEEDWTYIPRVAFEAAKYFSDRYGYAGAGQDPLKDILEIIGEASTFDLLPHRLYRMVEKLAKVYRDRSDADRAEMAAANMAKAAASKERDRVP